MDDFYDFDDEKEITESAPETQNAEGDEPSSYETAYEELQTIIRKMENGKLSLDESIKAYERGSKLVKFCESELKRYEEAINKLTEKTE